MAWNGVAEHSVTPTPLYSPRKPSASTMARAMARDELHTNTQRKHTRWRMSEETRRVPAHNPARGVWCVH